MEQITGLQPQEKDLIIKDISTLDNQIKDFRISDDETRRQASVILSSVKSKIKEVNTKRDSILKPIKSGIRLIEEEFKLILNPLSKFEIAIKAEIAHDYQVQEEIRLKAEIKAKQEEEKKLARLQDKLNSDNQLKRELAENKAEQIKNETDIKLSAVEVKTHISTGVGSTNIRKIWTYEVLDPNQVPVEYKTIDSALINSAIREGKREIPGLRIFEKPIVAGR